MVEGTLAQGVRWGRWKAIRQRPGAELEIYDLERDPAETKTLSAADVPEVAARMEKWLAGARVPPRPHDNGNPEWVGRKDIPPEG
jgi:hypothetical protein